MQTREIIEHNIQLGHVLATAARKRRDEAFKKWEAAPQGSQQKRRAYDKLVEEEKEVVRAETAVGQLEWVLSEPIGWRHFAFHSRQPYHEGPFVGTYCGKLVFLENTPEVAQLVAKGYEFWRTPAGSHDCPPSAAINYVDTKEDFEQLVAQTSNFRLSMRRPDLTN